MNDCGLLLYYIIILSKKSISNEVTPRKGIKYEKILCSMCHLACGWFIGKYFVALSGIEN